MNKKQNQTREEFEESATTKLKSAIEMAKQIRDTVRLLEKGVADREKKIRNYQKTFEEIEKELVKIQAKLYAGGTA